MDTKYIFVLSPTSLPYLKPCKVCHTLDGIKPYDEPDLHPAVIEGGQPDRL